MTLPLIYALNQATWLEKRRIINIIRNESHKPKKVSEVIAFVKDSGGLRYAQEVMQRYVEEARVLLNEFADSPHRTSLEQLVQYTIERSK
jgi:octaprenyl-diphosphate synthase